MTAPPLVVVLPIWAVVSTLVKLSFVVVLTLAVSPDDRPSSTADNLLVVVNALFISTGAVADLAFEAIGAGSVRRRRRRRARRRAAPEAPPGSSC
jgi:hypothetical protein